VCLERMNASRPRANLAAMVWWLCVDPEPKQRDPDIQLHWKVQLAFGEEMGGLTRVCVRSSFVDTEILNVSTFGKRFA
jgi:hypothetical protein